MYCSSSAPSASTSATSSFTFSTTFPFASKNNTMECVVMLFNGISNDFPYVACPSFDLPSNRRAYLIPHSLFGATECLRGLSKSQRGKLHEQLNVVPGARFRALIVDNVVQALIFIEHTKKFHYVEGLRSNQFQVECVFPDKQQGIAPRCFIHSLGMIGCVPNLPGPSPIPNLVYEAVLDCNWSIENNGGKQSGVNTHMRLVTMIVSRLIRIKPYSYDDRQTYDVLQCCSWIASRISSRQIRLPFQRHRDSPIPPARPSPPQREFKRELLWHFNCNNQTQVIMAWLPKTFIRFKPNPGQKWYFRGKELTYPELKDGELFTADLVYNEFLCDSQNGFGAYYITNYWKSNKKSHQAVLPSRTVVVRCAVEYQYQVYVKESCLFKDFYVYDSDLCLGYNLIVDNNKILRNVDLERHRLKGCPVWIRLERDHDRLAHFTIAGLHTESGEYEKDEKMMDYPILRGIGIMIDMETGAVLAQNYPQTSIRLIKPDRQRVPIGHYFYFSAAYHKEHYIVGNWQLITRKKPVKAFCIGNKLYFKIRLQFGTIQMGHQMHLSEEFGPVYDKKQLVAARAKKDETAYPDTMDTSVCYNPNWVPGRDAQMALHSLTPPEDKEQMVAATSTTVTKNDSWWAERHWNHAEQTCGCIELWHLLQEVKLNKKGLQKSTLKAVDRLLTRNAHMATENHYRERKEAAEQEEVLVQMMSKMGI